LLYLRPKGTPHPALGTTRWSGKNRSRASSALRRPVIGGPFDGDLRWLMVPVERSLLRCPAASRAPPWPGGLCAQVKEEASAAGGGRGTWSAKACRPRRGRSGCGEGEGRPESGGEPFVQFGRHPSRASVHEARRRPARAGPRRQGEVAVGRRIGARPARGNRAVPVRRRLPRRAVP